MHGRKRKIFRGFLERLAGKEGLLVEYYRDQKCSYGTFA